ncbi:MAG: hypothetical protein QNJ75_12065 [Acidimicrobiia bacterium]|nr:hypothetical protein [Acidimicrobiia bacterium]
MSIWVIGAIAYLAVLLFAFALARVASASDHPDGPMDGFVEEPDSAPEVTARTAGDSRS